MIYLVYTIMKIYLFRPEIVSQIRVPPIMPLIPYIDRVVTFLPPFYFTYWIVILAVIAISHELAHGIFAAYYKVGIKKTGFGFFPFFLPVFLAAFVELDEKQMAKKKNFNQRAILSAGTFANVLTAILFLVVLWMFFSSTFTAGGVVFNDYSYSIVPIGSITMVNGIAVANPSYESLEKIMKDADFNDIRADGKKYLGIKGFSENKSLVALYDDAPAINAKLNGAITEINGEKVKNINELGKVLEKYEPGDKIIVRTERRNNVTNYEITLGENPQKPGNAWIGIILVAEKPSGLGGKITSLISSFKDSNTYYVSKIGEFGWFIYYLLWWLVIISISVALVNMLPMGIFDGGRFFYLTILSITGSERAAKHSFKLLTKIFLFLLFVLMAFWVYALVR